MITSIYRNFFQFRRFLEIARIILKHVYWEWKSKRPATKRKRNRENAPQLIAVSTPERIRLTIEELGPTYIKFGQILADRPDVVAEKFRHELKKLQSGAVPMADKEALSLIELELGDKIENIFEEFDPHCLASASIGQVYKAKLKNGDNVVVKIQRPFIENKIKLDLLLMHWFANRLVKGYPDLAAINIIGAIDEFGESIKKELDYTCEASNMIRFQSMFADDQTVYIPKVYMEYTTRRLMVQERLVGISPDSSEKLREAGLDPQQIAENGANALLKMILGNGFFHADPHAGNMFILPGNVIGFIDFGMVGVLRPKDMTFLAAFAIGFLSKNAHAVANSLVTLCGAKFFEQTEDLEFEIQQLISRYEHIPINQVDFAQVLQACLMLVIKYQLQIPGGIFMLGKSLATIQKVAEALNPEIAIIPLLQPYAKDILKMTLSPRKVATEVFETVQDYLALIRSLPNNINEILYKMKSGGMRHDIRLSDSEMVRKVVGQLSRRLAFAIIIIGVFIGSVMMINGKTDERFGAFMLFFSSAIIILTLIKWLFVKK